MTVIQHLEEFRYRLIVSLLAVLVGTILAYIFYIPILNLLKHPLDEGGRIGDVRVDDLFVTGITTAFVLRVKISFFAGVVIALPVTLYQLWRFITPGLESREKRFAVPFVLSSLALFALGPWFAFLILPTGIRFLLSFAGPPLTPLIHLSEYLSFVTLMILAFGITFEFPLVLVFLGMVGIVRSERLRSWRRYAFFISFVVAAVATPSQDPFSMLIMAGPLYVLYEISILVIRFALKR
jgi:sec-independent protein translocase protein TatC